MATKGIETKANFAPYFIPSGPRKRCQNANMRGVFFRREYYFKKFVLIILRNK
jgi:hypothetical protein